jgi:iron complex outermembrane receptor protein
MKYYLNTLISAVFILVSLQSTATGTPGKNYSGSLSGKVTEKTSGKPVAGATVYISDLKLGAVTDATGQYSFRNLPSGTFLIEARSIGFKAITTNVTINGAVVQNFELSENMIEESEVVVTGLSKATQIRRSPIPIVSVNHAYMATNINTNIIDAITRVPGVTAVTTGPNVSKPYIRGLGFNRILTLYDGVRQEGQQWGDEHGIEVDQYGIDRIEIVKGPASLSYGSDAVAGVVNLIPTQPAPEGKIIGDIMGEYHSNNKMIAGSGMLGGTSNGFEWMGRLSHKQATNYQNKIDGRVFGTAFNETDVTGYLGLHKKWGYSHLSFSMFNDLQEIPDGSRDSATGKFTKQVTEDDLFRPIVTDAELKSYTIADLHQHIRHYRVYSNNSFSLGKDGRVTLNLAYQNSRRQEFSHPEFKTTPGLQLDLNTFNYDIKYYLPETRGWNFTVGVNGMYQKNDVTKGTEFIIPSYHQFDLGPFAMAKKTINKIDISGGLRWDMRSFTNSELYTLPDPVTGFDRPVYGADTVGADLQFSKYSHVFSGISGSLGLTYNATDKLSFKANVARGFRAPNISEIAANGVHPGTNIYQIGNPNFKPEANWQEDIGFSYQSKYVVVNMSIFYNTINNYIFNQRLLTANGDDSVIVAGNQTYKFQQGKAVLYGGEMNIDFHPAKKLHFENSFSLVYGDNKATGGIKLNPGAKYLPFIPPFHGLSELRYDIISKARHLANGYVKAQLVYYAAQKRVYSADNTETPTPGYTLFNLGAGTGFKNKYGKTVVILSVIANNLFDVAYLNHLSRLKYFLYSDTDTDPDHGIHEMGRNVAVKLEFPLSFSSK